jgi:phosphatidylserine synthase
MNLDPPLSPTQVMDKKRLLPPPNKAALSQQDSSKSRQGMPILANALLISKYSFVLQFNKFDSQQRIYIITATTTLYFFSDITEYILRFAHAVFPSLVVVVHDSWVVFLDFE